MNAQYKSSRKDWSKMRIILLLGVLILVWAGLWVRTYFIQVVHGLELSGNSRGQYWTEELVRGHRGDIYSAGGSLLAKSVTVDSVFVRPEEITDPDRVTRLLSQILGQEQKDLAERINGEASFVWIERKIGDRNAERIRSRDLSGVYLTEESKRLYPQGHLAGQLIGFVGMDNHGLEGLEMSLDSYLSGEKEELLVQRDAYGRTLYAPGELSENLSGGDITLTLDTRVQFSAEKAVESAVQSFEAKHGTLLVVKVDNGHILASAQYPFFNPNRFSKYSSQVWRNRAAMDAFEPGSSMKPFLVASALEKGLCTPQTIYYCENGKWRFQGQLIKDTHSYGWLSVRKVLIYSSNIGASKIGLDLKAEPYYQDLRELGLGRDTSLPLPSENEGILRRSEKWHSIDLASASFGQGFSLNLYQMGRAYLCLANKGVRKPLTLVQDPARDKPDPHRVYSEQTAEDVLSMMNNVVEGNGTGTRADIQGVRVGGKTGTAQKAMRKGGYGDEYVAIFAGLIPAPDPEYLVLAMVDSPTENHYGGVVAAPAVRKVGRTLLRHADTFRKWQPASGEDVTRASREEESEVESPRMVTLSNWEQKGDASGVPDLRGMPLRLALGVLARQGVMPQVKGSGVVVTKQSPKPGGAWNKEDMVLWLGGDKGKG